MVNLDPNESYISDIPLLSNYISDDLLVGDYKKKYILQDYIFICFLQMISTTFSIIKYKNSRI